VPTFEDRRSSEHGGVDAIRVAGAVLANLEAGRRAEGGSTITQQLARLSFLTRDKTYRRKVKEIVLASYIEREYQKSDILEMYLNKVYFGDGLYGVEAAAQGYLGKSASDLTVDEAALLAGLIQSPSAYAPTGNLDRALARRAVVLQTMVSSGAIDAQTAERAKTAPVKLVNALEVNETNGLYFKEAVRRELVERFGWPRVSQGGLKVYTTLDTDLQRIAEALVEKSLLEIENRRGFAYPSRTKVGKVKEGSAPDYLQGALISIDPTTGYVRAMVGGRDFRTSSYNRAMNAKRQPGSAFKPFVYAAAVEDGYGPDDMIEGLIEEGEATNAAWTPDDEHLEDDAVSLRDGLRMSSNRAAVRLLDEIGLKRTIKSAKGFGFNDLPVVPSVALGSGEVTLSQITAAYGAFANDGAVFHPILIRKVLDHDGLLLFEDRQEPQQAIRPVTAYLMADMLRGVIDGGTAYGVRQMGFTLPAAGKTGTTNDYKDAWFIGFTPTLVTGVWVGYDQPHTIRRHGYAAEIAVPMWTRYMKAATKGQRAGWLTRPRGAIRDVRVSPPPLLEDKRNIWQKVFGLGK
jgi:penicillin-binding protein 1A